MKKFIITAVLALVPSLFFAQSAFDKFNDLDDVTAVVINKKTFDLFDKMDFKMDEKTQKYVRQITNINKFKMFSTANVKISDDMKQTFEAYRKKENLEPLLSIKDGGNAIRIYVKSTEDSSKVSEFVMFLEGGDKKGDETVLLSLTGDFDLAALDK